MKAQAYVFIDTENPSPKRIVAEVIRLRSSREFGTLTQR